MKLVICHKGNDTFVNLSYPNADAARRARTFAKKIAMEKRSRMITFGPDMYDQDCEIHVDCLGSTSIVLDEHENEKRRKDQERAEGGNGKARTELIEAKPEPAPVPTPEPPKAETKEGEAS